MHRVKGTVSMFLYNSDGMLTGFLLDGGQEVRFPANRENISAVRRILPTNSIVEVRGEVQPGDNGDEYVEASFITNLTSQRTATLPRLSQSRPGMLSDGAPNKVASLAHPGSGNSKISDSKKLEVSPIPERHGCAVLEPGVNDADSQSLRPGSYFHSLMQKPEGHDVEEVGRNIAARCIGHAYDSLHRIQAILAYLHIIQHRVPGISQFLDEGKHTYEQALARFGNADFSSAKEFAQASDGLSRVVEIVMARTLRCDTSLPSLVPPPPGYEALCSEPQQVEEHLVEAENVLSRIHWVLENGTLPSEDRAQVRRIASWGDALYKQAQRTYRSAVLEDAAELALAALAGAHSAEHVCRKWYTSHPAHS